MNELTIVPQKKIKGYLATKRQIQRFSEKQVRLIAKNLRIPFAVNDDQAREIIARWRKVIRDPLGRVMRDNKGRPMFFQPRQRIAA